MNSINKNPLTNLLPSGSENLNIVLHLESESLLSTYPEYLQHELIEILNKYRFEITIITSVLPEDKKFTQNIHFDTGHIPEAFKGSSIFVGVDGAAMDYAINNTTMPVICLVGKNNMFNPSGVRSNVFFLSKELICSDCRSDEYCTGNGSSFCGNFPEPEDVLKQIIEINAISINNTIQNLDNHLSSPKIRQDLRIIALYLPQFRRVPENDVFWGTGFTEWTNVAKARPLFRGHYQPHIPADLGYYDTSNPATKEQQAELAKKYGITGFCYYHYWFHGKQILQNTFEEVFESGNPDFPFCLCWANENWTRRWDGSDSNILLEMKYSADDDLNHIKSLIPKFKDKRYIKIDGKPVFLVYRAENLPEPVKTTEIWRMAAKRAGFPGLYLVCVENFESDKNPEEIGFDAAIEFAPDIREYGSPLHRTTEDLLAIHNGELEPAFLENNIYDYNTIVDNMMVKPKPDYKRFRCVFPNWDNSPRRQKIKGATIIHGSAPEKFREFLEKMMLYTERHFSGDEKILFINAWNEWGEGCHLEPDLNNGLAYLEAIKQVVEFNKPDKQNEKFLLNSTPENSRLLKHLNYLNNKMKKETDTKVFRQNNRNGYNHISEAGHFYAQLFYDTGNGFNEAESIRIEASEISKSLIFNFNSETKINKFRIDPVENAFSVIKIGSARCLDKAGNESLINYSDSNAFLIKADTLMFRTIDPQITFNGFTGLVSRIILELEYLAVGESSYKFFYKALTD